MSQKGEMSEFGYIPGTFQSSIFRRFLKEDELKNLYKSYREHSQSGFTGKDRKNSWTVEVSREEKDLLAAYIENTDTSVVELAKAAGFKSGGTYADKAKTTAIKLLYQNQELMRRLVEK